MSIKNLRAALKDIPCSQGALAARQIQHYQEFNKFCHWIDDLCGSFSSKINSVEEFHRAAKFFGLDLESASFNRDLGRLLTQRAINIPRSDSQEVKRQNFIFDYLIAKTPLRHLVEPSDLAGGLFKTIADQQRFEKLLDLIFSHSLIQVYQSSTGNLKEVAGAALPQFADLSLDKAAEQAMCNPVEVALLANFNPIPYNDERYQIAQSAFRALAARRNKIDIFSKFLNKPVMQEVNQQLSMSLRVLSTFTELPQDSALVSQLQTLLQSDFARHNNYYAGLLLRVLAKMPELDYDSRLVHNLAKYLDSSAPGLQIAAAKALTKIDWFSNQPEPWLLAAIFTSLEKPFGQQTDLTRKIYLASLFDKFDLAGQSIPRAVQFRASSSSDHLEIVLWRNIASAYRHIPQTEGRIVSKNGIFLPYDFRHLCSITTKRLDLDRGLHQMLADDRESLLLYLRALAYAVMPSEQFMEHHLVDFNHDLVAFKLGYDRTNDTRIERATTALEILLTAFEKFKPEIHYSERILDLIVSIGDLAVQSLFEALTRKATDKATVDNIFAALDHIVLKEPNLVDKFFTEHTADARYLATLQKEFDDNPHYALVYQRLAKYLHLKNLL